MSTSFDELKTISFRDIQNLRLNDGYVSADIAVWLTLERPADVTSGRLFLRYFANTGYREIILDRVVQPIGSPALLSARARIPIELRNTPMTVCLDLNGSAYKLDTVHVQPLLDGTKNTAERTLYAA
jgi:hypothetical protein